MKNIRSLCLLVASAAVLSSCAAARPLGSAVDASQIGELAIIGPMSSIYYIEHGNRAELNDSLSYESAMLITNLVGDVRGMPPIAEVVVPADDSVRAAIMAELDTYLALLEKTPARKRHLLAVPAIVTDVLAANGHRFGLVITADGFIRRRGNYGNQVAVGIGVGILSLGTYVPVPVRSHSNVTCLIVDAQTGAPVFYDRRFTEDGEPLDADDVSSQLGKIFENYFGQNE